METQVDVLEGKRRALARYRDALAGYLERHGRPRSGRLAHAGRARRAGGDVDGQPATVRHADAPMSAAVSRLVLGAPGGPAPRDRPGDARRPGPEPDQHRAPGPDRRAPRRARSDDGGRRGPPAHRDGPADARCHQVVHLRRAPDGPRRPRPRADAAPRHPRARPARRDRRSSSTRSARTGACRWTSRAACSGCSTRRSAAYLGAGARPRGPCAWIGRSSSRPGSSRPAPSSPPP